MLWYLYFIVNDKYWWRYARTLSKLHELISKIIDFESQDFDSQMPSLWSRSIS